MENLIPHLETMFKFMTQSLPRPLIAALLFRLVILQLASRIVAKMGDDAWEDDDASVGWEGRPVSRESIREDTVLIKVTEHKYHQFVIDLSTNHLYNGVFASSP